MKNARRGSVMMELVVVLPIYLVLFGGVFMLGDMLIRSIRLPSAERIRAFDLGRSSSDEPGWNHVANDLFHPDREINERKDATDNLDHGNEKDEYYADTEIEGPFTVRTAAKVRDDYSLLAGGSRGQMAFAYRLFQGRLAHDPVDDVEKDALTLYQPGGRMKMYSKPEEEPDGGEREYDYNYYTLRRYRYAENEYTWRDNRRYEHELLTRMSKGVRVWESVKGESTHDSVVDGRNRKQSTASVRGKIDYMRYGERSKDLYFRWSN